MALTPAAPVVEPTNLEWAAIRGYALPTEEVRLTTLAQYVASYKRFYVYQALKATGNVGDAARWAGYNRTQFYMTMRRCGLFPPTDELVWKDRRTSNGGVRPNARGGDVVRAATST